MAREENEGATAVATRKSEKKARKKEKAKAKQKLADQYDRHWLYQKSVQEPEADVRFMRRVFKKTFDRPARVMREDFCGTGYLSCTWAKASPKLSAFGIDIDPDPLSWGELHNRALLADAVRERVELIEGNALDISPRKADVICALNFSWFCFHERDQLLEYFRAAYQNLPEEGLFILDIEGGPEAQSLLEEEREVDGFDYVWIRTPSTASAIGRPASSTSASPTAARCRGPSAMTGACGGSRRCAMSSGRPASPGARSTGRAPMERERGTESSPTGRRRRTRRPGSPTSWR